MLAEAWRAHRGALSASMWAVYQIDIEAPPVGALRLAELMEHLPGGCALWQSVGGPRAWSDELHGLYLLELRIRQLLWQGAGDKSKPQPKPIPYPEVAGVEEAKARELEDANRRFEERFG